MYDKAMLVIAVPRFLVFSTNQHGIMKFWALFVSVLCLAGLVASKPQSDEDCLKPCPLIFEPVCACHKLQYGPKECRTFPNKCFMENENCQFRGDWKIASNRPC